MILAGDVGGTKTRLALYDVQQKQYTRKDTETFASRDYSSLEEVVTAFLRSRRVRVECACLGVPGPVMNGEVEVTNLPWRLSERRLSQATGIARFRLVNDLVATMAAVPHLKKTELQVLHPGKGADLTAGPCAVLAPGTGLGQAFLTWKDGEPQIHPSEGGHVDFAATDDEQVELYRHLRDRFGRVSYERVLSGPGLVNIYSFLRDRGFAAEPPELKARLAGEDPAAVISAAGMRGEFELCVKALDMFAAILGAQAGNLVMSLLATGGVFLGGGIPPKIAPKLAEGLTVRAYLNKGRLSNIVMDTPLSIIKDDHAALLGAASIAASL
ncbi:MAG: glucokinase [Calditrichaeota bacterium]|nr:MAG: glucokinase [Calditrichota bacterium]